MRSGFLDNLELGVRSVEKCCISCQREYRNSQGSLEHEPRSSVSSKSCRSVSLDQDRILRLTRCYAELGGNTAITFKSLERFDDTRCYGQENGNEERLVEAEVRKLINSVSCDDACLFSSEKALDFTDSESFEYISKAAESIAGCLDIVANDYMRLGMRNCPKLFQLSEFEEPLAAVLERYPPEQRGMCVELDQSLDQDRLQRIVVKLVEYTLTIVAKTVVSIAGGRHWKEHIIAVLAMWTVKLKFLSSNPSSFAKMSVTQASKHLKTLKESQRKPLQISIVSDSGSKEPTIKESDVKFISQYFYKEIQCRRELKKLAERAVLSLWHQQDPWNSASCFEHCVVLYRMGLDRIPAVLTKGCSSRISASSSPKISRCSYYAISIAQRNCQTLADSQGEGSCSTSEEESGAIKTTISWNWCESLNESHEKKQPKNFETCRIDDVVSVQVPLSLAAFEPAQSLLALLTQASVENSEQESIIQNRPEVCPRPMFCVSTADWHAKRRNSQMDHNPEFPWRPISPISDEKGATFCDALFDIIECGRHSTPTQSCRGDRAKTRKFNKQLEYMRTWMISEGTITIRCQYYVYSIISFAFIFGLGSIAIPFTVGARIPGVDPFQVTIYCWALAGMILIVCKSIYVSNWPWHDFLRSQVICRSLSEASHVSGIDPQAILLHLLDQDYIGILQTKGPYNSMFRNKSKGEFGFAIDRLVATKTMQESGFLILKVLNEVGSHLICVDSRKGTTGKNLVKLKEDEYLAGKVMENYEGNVQHRKQEKAIHRVSLKTERLRYNRVFGLYTGDAYFG